MFLVCLEWYWVFKPDISTTSYSLYFQFLHSLLAAHRSEQIISCVHGSLYVFSCEEYLDFVCVLRSVLTLTKISIIYSLRTVWHQLVSIMLDPFNNEVGGLACVWSLFITLVRRTRPNTTLVLMTAIFLPHTKYWICILLSSRYTSNNYGNLRNITTVLILFDITNSVYLI